MICLVDCVDPSVNTSDVVLTRDMANLAGCGGGGRGDVVISRLHYTIQCTTVLLLCNELLVVSNHAASEYSEVATAAAAWRSDGLRPIILVVVWAGWWSAVPPVTM